MLDVADLTKILAEAMTNNLHVSQSEGNVVNNEAVISFMVTTNDLDKNSADALDVAYIPPKETLAGDSASPAATEDDSQA